MLAFSAFNGRALENFFIVIAEHGQLTNVAPGPLHRFSRPEPGIAHIAIENDLAAPAHRIVQRIEHLEGSNKSVNVTDD